jgi:hypothetical protein
MAMSAMYGEAFFEIDVRKLVEFSLKVIPAESGYAEMVRFVIAAHDKHPDNWQAAWQELEVKAKASGWASKVDVRINGAYVYMGLLYGEGDYMKTLSVSMRCGRDPKTGKMDKPTMREIYPDYLNWDDVLASTVEIGMQNIVANGGRIEDGMIYIPVQMPAVPALEQVPDVKIDTKK